jgi:hypothetical protein
MSHDVDLAYAYSTCRQIVCFVSPNANLEGKQTRRADRHRIKLHTNLRFDREDVQVIWHYYGAVVTLILVLQSEQMARFAARRHDQWNEAH